MDKKLYKVFKALGEPSRLKIVKMLSVQSMCVCELCEVLNMLQPRVSQHLRILKEAEVVYENREGYWVYYSLDRDKLQELWQSFQAFLNADLKSLRGFESEYDRLINLDSNERVIKTKNKLRERGSEDRSLS